MQPPVGTIAMLFTDIEGSTALASRLGARWPAVLADHHRLVADAIAAEGGYVDGTEGDAFFATFTDAAAAGRAATAASCCSPPRRSSSCVTRWRSSRWALIGSRTSLPPSICPASRRRSPC